MIYDNVEKNLYLKRQNLIKYEEKKIICLLYFISYIQTTKPYIVQLHKTRNVTAPKDNETSSNRPHLYRLTITDGHVFQNALILPSLRNFK